MTHYPKPEINPEVVGDPPHSSPDPDPIAPSQPSVPPVPSASKKVGDLARQETRYDPKFDPKPGSTQKESEAPGPGPKPDQGESHRVNTRPGDGR